MVYGDLPMTSLRIDDSFDFASFTIAEPTSSTLLCPNFDKKSEPQEPVDLTQKEFSTSYDLKSAISASPSYSQISVKLPALPEPHQLLTKSGVDIYSKNNL